MGDVVAIGMLFGWFALLYLAESRNDIIFGVIAFLFAGVLMAVPELAIDVAGITNIGVGSLCVIASIYVVARACFAPRLTVSNH